MDESPKQLIEKARQTIPMKPGQEARAYCEYIRKGVVNILWQMNP